MRPTKTSAAVLDAARALRSALADISFGPPAAWVYDPLDYAWAGYRAYVERFVRGPRELMILGMNPGPFGMAQTGVPFGEVTLVTQWMGIDVEVGRPAREHPARPVEGFRCHRSEVSGARLWGAVAHKHADPATFFARVAVLNVCPLLFLDEGGRNVTPDKLVRADRIALDAACDVHLRRLVTVLRPRVVFGVGAWAERRARTALCSSSSPSIDPDLQVALLPHPSPASPQANRGWTELARRAIIEAGVEPFL